MSSTFFSPLYKSITFSKRSIVHQFLLTMESNTFSKSFGCFSPKGLKFGLSSKSSTCSTSPSSSQSPRSMVMQKTVSKEDELREVFRRFDSDNDNKISAFELRAYFASVGEYMSHEEAQGVIDELDMDGDHLIDFVDFSRLMKREDDDDDGGDDLKMAFEMFELEKGGGRITPKSLQRVLSRLGDSKSYDECVAMIRVFDIDGNGELDFHEFHQMMA